MVLTPIYMCLHNVEHIKLPLYPGTGRSQPMAKNAWEHWEHREQAQKCQINHGFTIQGVFPKAFFGLGTLGTPHITRIQVQKGSHSLPLRAIF